FSSTALVTGPDRCGETQHDADSKEDGLLLLSFQPSAHQRPRSRSEDEMGTLQRWIGLSELRPNSMAGREPAGPPAPSRIPSSFLPPPLRGELLARLGYRLAPPA